MTIDLKDVDGKAAFHTVMKNHLNFPEWYGANWDAFWDTITALVELPDCLVLKNWGNFAQTSPKDMQLLRQIIDDFHQKFPLKQIILAP